MPLLNKKDQRTQIAYSVEKIVSIEQKYNQVARLQSYARSINAACIKCHDPKCIQYREEEIKSEQFPDYSYERNTNVCPVNAIKWDYHSEMPMIDARECINCGICASRCPIGAIYNDGKRVVIRNDISDYVVDSYSEAAIEKQSKFIEELEKISWRRQYIKESESLLQELCEYLKKCDGRSMVPNLLVRNLLISMGYKCAVSRAGDVYTRTDAVYSSDKCKGAVEIEFGRDTLEASRGILDDIAVLHSRNGIDKHENKALVVCLSLPNKRQGYFQVIKDIENVLGIKVQTLTVGALVILLWNGEQIKCEENDFYVDFDNTSIRKSIEKILGRKCQIRAGALGILEPEK